MTRRPVTEPAAEGILPSFSQRQATIALMVATAMQAFDAAIAGLILSPRGVMTLLTMLALARLIGRIDHRVFLVIGLVTTAAALELFTNAPQRGAALWLAGSNALLGMGAGLLFTPLSTLAFSTLGEDLRADGAGVYNLLRQLGCAAGVAIMAALLQARIGAHVAMLAESGHPHLRGSTVQLLNTATFAAYSDCFRVMAIATLAIIPGIFIFRVLRRDRGLPDAA